MREDDNLCSTEQRFNNVACLDVSRHPPDYVSRRSRYGGGTQYKKRGANNLAIARRIIATEKRRATYTASIDPDDPTNVNDDQAISGLILRYKKRGRIITENVCKGIFP